MRRNWHRYEKRRILLLAGSCDASRALRTLGGEFRLRDQRQLPGWHTTIFPPYFVAGAIFSGMAMVLTLMLIARSTMRLQDYLTVNHVESMCKLVLVTSCLVALAYGTEFFIALYSGNRYERFVFINRALGPMAWSYWIMVSCNVLVPQLLWFRKIRRTLPVVFVISILVNLGMWFERFVIIVTSLYQDFLPSSWTNYIPTSIEVATLIGSFGLFFTCFLLFCRFLPVIAMGEVKGVLKVGRAPRRGSPAVGGGT